jgi:hypothetical protein
MHSAPAVRYPVGLSHHLMWAVAALWLLAVSLGAWWYANGGTAWQLAAHAACVLASGVAAALVLRTMPRGILRWDGRTWWWGTGEIELPVTVTLHFDFQRVIWLRVSGLPGRDPWCCVERAAGPRAWDDLRCALHASPRSTQTPDAGGGMSS